MGHRPSFPGAAGGRRWSTGAEREDGGYPGNLGWRAWCPSGREEKGSREGEARENLGHGAGVKVPRVQGEG